MARFNDYMLAVGEETRERLKLLGGVYNPLSIRFLCSLLIDNPQETFARIKWRVKFEEKSD